jgi:hypothetical protein
MMKHVYKTYPAAGAYRMCATISSPGIPGTGTNSERLFTAATNVGCAGSVTRAQ